MGNLFSKKVDANAEEIAEEITEKIVEKINDGDYIRFFTRYQLIHAINEIEKEYDNNTPENISKTSNEIISIIYGAIELIYKNEPDDELIGNIILKIRNKLNSTAQSKYHQYVAGDKTKF